MPQIDHLIVLVKDLEATAADYAALGFTIQERADTSHGNTAFRFISFEDGSYILLTTYTTEEAARTHRLAQIFAEGEGFVDYSFTVTDVDAAAAAAKAKGGIMGPIHDVQNLVKSGETWSLKLLVSGRGAGGDDALPFLVQDTQGRSARIPASVPHANGALGLKSLTIGSEKPAETAALLAALVGVENDALTLDMGSYKLEVVANAADLAGRRNGGGLASISLRVAPGTPAKVLDLALTHGAIITLEA